MTIKTQNFNPVLNYTISGTNASVAQAIAQPSAISGIGYGQPPGGGYTDIQFVNPNGFMAFASWTNGTATAGTATSAPLPPNSTIAYDMGGPMTSVAVILGSSTSGNIDASVGGGS